MKVPNMSKICTLKETGDLLLKSQRIVICSHINPDGDTLGSNLTLGLALKQAGKQVTMTVDDDIPTTFAFMPGITELVRLPEGSKLAADLLVVVDASSADRVGKVLEQVETPVLLNIDHHKTNTYFADYLYLDAQAAATCEIMYELLQTMKLPLNQEMAMCNFTGLYTDTGSFKYSNTTCKTMRTAAELLNLGVDPSYISDNIEIKSQATVAMLGKVLDTLTFRHNGAIAYVEISKDLYDKNVDTDTFISYPRYIEGVEIALLFKEVEDGLTRVSMRSRRADVSKIALRFGGGGHVKAAGCSVHKHLQAAKDEVLAVVEAVLS